MAGNYDDIGHASFIYIVLSFVGLRFSPSMLLARQLGSNENTNIGLYGCVAKAAQFVMKVNAVYLGCYIARHSSHFEVEVHDVSQIQ